MTKYVRLLITGTQYDDQGEENVTRLSCDGEYYFRGGSHYILYQERSPETGEITRNTLKLKGNMLEHKRQGAVSSLLVFEPLKEHLTQYRTPAGMLTLGVLTRSLETRLEEDGLHISAEYLLTHQDTPLSRNTVTIKILSVRD